MYIVCKLHAWYTMEFYATANIHLDVNDLIRTLLKFRIANAAETVMGSFYVYANIAAIFAILKITLLIGCNKLNVNRKFLQGFAFLEFILDIDIIRYTGIWVTKLYTCYICTIWLYNIEGSDVGKNVTLRFPFTKFSNDYICENISTLWETDM